MRLYETLLLLDAARPDADIDAAITRVSGLVTERGGTIENTDRWGRRRLAYEIGGQNEGYYTVLTYSIDPTHRSEIDEALPFVEGLVRAKTVVPAERTRGVSK